MNLRLDRFINAALVWMLERVEDREQFFFHLERPLPGRVKQTDVDRELNEFSALVGKVGAT